MTRSRRKLLTLVAESGLENRLLTLITDAGARGYTVSSARGQGPRAEGASDITGGNTRIEAVMTEATLETILDLLAKDYFPHYSLTCWVADVEVVREDRY